MSLGIMTGVFHLYAYAIMPGLGKIDVRTFVGAFQSIDRAIINPLFMATFFGALVFTGLAALLLLRGDGRSVLPWVAAALVLYALVVVLTVAVNVPLNDQLKAAGDPDRIADLAAAPWLPGSFMSSAAARSWNHPFGVMPIHLWQVDGDTMNEQPGPSGDERGATGSGPAGRQRWRTIVAVLLIVIGCVLAPLAGVAVWARNQVTNTDRYVRTVAPLASDPAIQNAVADQITTQVFTYLDVQGLTNQAVDALAEQGVRPLVADRLRGFAGPLSSGIQSFVRTEVGKIVRSQAFADAWVQANRVAHQALVRALTGQGDGAVTVADDTVSVNLAPFIQTVKQRLVDSGFGLAARIPEVNASFVLFDVKNLSRAQAAFNLLNTLGIWLPIIAIVLLGIGVAVAKDHRRALAGAAVGVAVGMLVLALSLAVFRTIYLDAVPAAVLSHDAAATAYDTIVWYLRLGLRAVLVLALVVAAGALVTGPSATAVRTRQRLAAAIGRLRGGAEDAGLRTGPVGTWVGANKQLLRVGAVTLAVLALVFWGQPTGKVILLLAGLLLVALALIEFLGQPPRPTVAPTTRA